MRRQLAAFLGRLRAGIGLPFGRSRSDVQAELGAYWAALNIYVVRGEIDPTTLIPVGYQDGRGFAGFMSVQAVLRIVQDGWGRWDSKTEARWCQILEETSRNLLRKETDLSREL